MTGIARAIALVLAERCLVNQEVRAPPGVDGRSARSRITRERDDATGASGTHKSVRRQPSAICQLDRLTLRELAPQWPFRDSRSSGLVDVKAPAPHVLLDDVAE